MSINEILYIYKKKVYTKLSIASLEFKKENA